ncbi:MAG: 4-hydroxythreonine-4-phosphate dehydrogenase PdxA [Methanothrix sp.]|nr:4-hydroxythreonine-4-phosphate dehydrogenase PdxA [Methanothrix sp.]
MNGVGPEILVKALSRPELFDVFRPLVFGSVSTLESVRHWALACPRFVVVNGAADIEDEATIVPVMECGLAAPVRRPGQLDREAGRCAVEWLKAAIRSALAGKVDGIVTCPLNKEGIHLAGYSYSGHTEVLAEMTASPDYRMCLFTDRMRIVHISSHCALREAIEEVRQDRIATSIRIAHETLTRLGLPRRSIAVAGLNPHAGEAGLFGDEEQREILPAVEECRGEGIACSGPYPPDTVFRRMWEGEFDLVVAMYHDQGHIPLKLIAMDEGVNVTLGIPIVRTSVDHGTAYDIAGCGIAREHSLCKAIELAARLAKED